MAKSRGWRLPALTAAASALAAGAAFAHDDPARFTFPWASHVDERTGDYAAQQFVQKQLAAGLPMDKAVARVQAAHASCRSEGAGAFVCRYSISAASNEASLGQEVWTITLTPGPGGKLATAAIERSRVGLPGELGTRAVFHWQLGD